MTSSLCSKNTDNSNLESYELCMWTCGEASVFYISVYVMIRDVSAGIQQESLELGSCRWTGDKGQ